MRDIKVIITAVINELPTSYVELRQSLEEIAESTSHTPPEMMHEKWRDVACALQDHLSVPDKSSPAWMQKIADILSGDVVVANGLDRAYVMSALATENPENFIKRMDEPNVPAFLHEYMTDITSGSYHSDVKRFLMYGKENDISKICSEGNIIETSFVRDNQSLLKARVKSIAFARLFHAAIGQMTEAHEKMQYLLQYLETGKIDFINAAEEAGDSFWYSALECYALGIDPKVVADTNIAKLRMRFADRFTNERAENRDLGAEYNILKENLAKQADNFQY